MVKTKFLILYFNCMYPAEHSILLTVILCILNPRNCVSIVLWMSERWSCHMCFLSKCFVLHFNVTLKCCNYSWNIWWRSIIGNESYSTAATVCYAICPKDILGMLSYLQTNCIKIALSQVEGSHTVWAGGKDCLCTSSNHTVW